jgi:heavy metal sensor kinase
MSRLSVRLRLTLAFALAMAVVLTAVGAFLYARLGDSLQEQLDETLQARAATIAAGGLGAGELSTGDDDGFAQALDSDGTVVDSSPSVAAGPLLSQEDLTRARDGSFFTHDSVAGVDGDARLFVRKVAGEPALVVGSSLEDRDEAVEGLLAQLLIVGPAALLLSSLAGYLLATAALRPVEAMRRRAGEVSSEQTGQRLPLPRARDEIHRLGETLNAMLGRLEAGLARERRFVADASHELRTPLASLRTELELALRRPRSPTELEGALRSAAEEVDRLTRLAEDLLVLAQADEGRLPIRPAPTLTGDLLGSVAERFASRAAAEGRAVEVAGSSNERFVADRLRVEQALGNLVDNALRHGAGTVRLEAERRDGRIELRVSDEGKGFSPEFVPRAFDRFTRADEARTSGGSGLGLAIVDAVVRAHGGSARAEGAAVVLTLPSPAGEVQ